MPPKKNGSKPAEGPEEAALKARERGMERILFFSDAVFALTLILTALVLGIPSGFTAAQLPGAVAALVGTAGAVQADIRPVGGDHVRRAQAAQFEDAERRIMTLQHFVNGRAVPAMLAEFEGVPMFPRQRPQELLEGFVLVG